MPEPYVKHASPSTPPDYFPVEAAGLRAPVATVVGEVVRLRGTLRWFD